MTIRARILRAADAADAKPLWPAVPGDRGMRRIAREEVEAWLAAERILEDARAMAEKMLADARAKAAGAVDVAVAEAREEADAKLAARWIALRQAECRATEKEEGRILATAIALAERLLVASLELDPGRILALARAVIAEAGGARHAKIDAHPLDAAALRTQLSMVALDSQSIEVRDDAALARGDLRLHTDLGIIDARLNPRFDRLAAALRNPLD